MKETSVRIKSFEWTLFILFGILLFFGYSGTSFDSSIPVFVNEINKYIYNINSFAVTFGLIIYGYYLHHKKINFTFDTLLRLLFKYTYILIGIAVINGLMFGDWDITIVSRIFTRQSSGVFNSIVFNIWWIPYSLFFGSWLYSAAREKFDAMSNRNLLYIIIMMLLIQYPGYQILTAVGSLNPVINTSNFFIRFIISSSGETFIQVFTLIVIGSYIARNINLFKNKKVLHVGIIVFVSTLVILSSFITWGQSIYIQNIPRIFRIIGDVDSNGSIVNLALSISLIIILTNINIKRDLNKKVFYIVVSIFAIHPATWIVASHMVHFARPTFIILFWMLITWIAAIAIYFVPKLFAKEDNSKDKKKNKAMKETKVKKEIKKKRA